MFYRLLLAFTLANLWTMPAQAATAAVPPIADSLYVDANAPQQEGFDTEQDLSAGDDALLDDALMEIDDADLLMDDSFIAQVRTAVGLLRVVLAEEWEQNKAFYITAAVAGVVAIYLIHRKQQEEATA